MAGRPENLHGRDLDSIREGSAIVRLALDTGATFSLVRTAILIALGYDPAATLERVAMTTASGQAYSPRLPVQRWRTLGHERPDSPMLAHTLPPSACVDGLLGLDFFRGMEVRIDLCRGEVSLQVPVVSTPERG